MGDWCANVDECSIEPLSELRESYHKMGLTLVPNLLSEIALFVVFSLEPQIEMSAIYVYFDPLSLLVGSKTAHAYRNRSISFLKDRND